MADQFVCQNKVSFTYSIVDESEVIGSLTCQSVTYMAADMTCSIRLSRSLRAA
jgi:hypothetical protein